MPLAIDQDALENPSLKLLDINKPPMKAIAHSEFPKAVYLHPVDKTRSHRVKIVQNAAELKDAQKQGWKPNPHVPVVPAEFEIDPTEYETGKSA